MSHLCTVSTDVLQKPDFPMNNANACCVQTVRLQKNWLWVENPAGERIVKKSSSKFQIPKKQFQLYTTTVYQDWLL
jgi:hypothetical protein